jgi:hypothetical protein
MFQHFLPYSYLNIQPLIDAVNKLAAPSGWVIAQTVISGLAVLLSLALALGAWRRSSWKNWLKIKKVYSSRLICRKKGLTDFVGLDLQVNIQRNHKIPMEIHSAYVELDQKIFMGYKNTTPNNVFIGPIQFQLMRTTKFREEDTMHEQLPADEFLEYSLRDKKFHDIKSGSITIYTNTGEYSRKLSKDEIKSFINTFDEVKEWVKI